MLATFKKHCIHSAPVFDVLAKKFLGHIHVFDILWTLLIDTDSGIVDLSIFSILSPGLTTMLLYFLLYGFYL